MLIAPTQDGKLPSPPSPLTAVLRQPLLVNYNYRTIRSSLININPSRNQLHFWKGCSVVYHPALRTMVVSATFKHIAPWIPNLLILLANMSLFMQTIPMPTSTSGWHQSNPPLAENMTYLLGSTLRTPRSLMIKRAHL